MRQRVLGKAGFKVSEIGLGCWQLGGDFGPLEDTTAHHVLDAALLDGINFWDTADVYGAGLSETRIGNYLESLSDEIHVATKAGRGGNLYPDGYSRAALRESILGSAQRLGVDTLDLVQLHCVPTAVLADGEILEWMAQLQQEGLLRAFGASVETLHEAQLAMRHPQLASLQIIFNLFRQDALTELFPQAQQQKVGIIVRLPLASGVLAGRMRPGQQFAASDHRQYNRAGQAFSRGETFSGLDFDTALALVDELRALVPDNMSMAQFALRWILDQPAVSTVICGASRAAQVQENAAVSALPALSPALHRQLADFYRQRVRGAIKVPL
jgi:aryl-alcohol dehydrogenase-like predicted oxidoreductase